MPMVTVTGRIRDAGDVQLGTATEPRLWFRPNKSYLTSGARAVSDLEVQATWDSQSWDGDFTVELHSMPERPDLWYTMILDYLPPGQETEPPENRARAHVEWPMRIYPGEGGDLGELVTDPIVVGGIYYGYGPPPVSLEDAYYMDISGEKAVFYAPAGGGI